MNTTKVWCIKNFRTFCLRDSIRYSFVAYTTLWIQTAIKSSHSTPAPNPRNENNEELNPFWKQQFLVIKSSNKFCNSINTKLRKTCIYRFLSSWRHWTELSYRTKFKHIIFVQNCFHCELFCTFSLKLVWVSFEPGVNARYLATKIRIFQGASPFLIEIDSVTFFQILYDCCSCKDVGSDFDTIMTFH